MGSGSSPWRRLARIIRPSPRSEVDEELAFHLEERVREYVAQGMEPEAARAAARERLGDLEGVREECVDLLTSERRTAARREWLKVSWLDFKLGFRMLAKYPGLTIIGGLAMAFAIWVGAGTFEFVRQVIDPVLPLDEGDRVVGIHVMDVESSGIMRRVGYEFVTWRDELRTVEHLGAFRTLDRNLITGEGRGEPVEVAEITASGFEVARVPPILGRTLVPADEAAGAPAVVVLGHDVWQQRFGGDPEIVGRDIRLGSFQATVVGVMPEGFAFPISQRLWMPLRSAQLGREPREGTALRIFGRLAPGASLDDAQAELTALGRRAAQAYPETHEHLRPRVLPYAESILYLPGPAFWAMGSINVFVALLLVLICGNVALLMFARAATRENEILVRGALGASRGRIVTQLFVEALVLGGLAAAVGLAAAGFGLRWLFSTVVAEVSGQNLPFWFVDRISPATVGYTLLLALLAAAVAGIVPALKVTGKKVESRLRQASAGGGGLRFGGVWTAVIVTQVAVTVAVPAFALILRGEMESIRGMDVGIAAEEYLSVRLEMDRELSAGTATANFLEHGASARLMAEAAMERPNDFQSRFEQAARELERRLEQHSSIRGATFGERLPGMYHPHRLVDVDEGGAAPLHPEWPAYRVSSVWVAEDYFEELDVQIQSGRDFHPGDLAADARVVIVNESFVQRVLGGRNPIGRHVRYAYFEGDEEMLDPETQPWYEIVGVVPDLGLSYGDYDPKVSGIYHPTRAGGVYPTHMAIHATGNPTSLVHDIRTLATAVDPGLRLYQPIALDKVDESEIRFYAFWFWILVLVSSVALLLSLAGIYAVMSFAVSRRTREIGIRVALGAGRGRIIAAIFRRPLTQLSLGLLGGAILVTTLATLAAGNEMTASDFGVITLYMAIMAAICGLACIVPTRRALNVEPVEALRTE